MLCAPTTKPSTAAAGTSRTDISPVLSTPKPQTQSGVQFSEAADLWRPVPPWAEFLLHFGFRRSGIAGDARRISLISMPCESAGAGLIVLGAMRCRFAIQGANDSSSHYQRIRNFVGKNGTGVFLRHKEYKGRFVAETKEDGFVWVRCDTPENGRSAGKKLTRTIVTPQTACDWYVDGEAPVQTFKGVELSHRPLYEGLISDSATIASNFIYSDSWICLAGRVAGESVSRNLFGTIRFRRENDVVDLAQLLTIQDWSSETVSRVNFFNARTGNVDRNTGLTRLVVADGDTAFLRVLESELFRASDVIGVIHRAVERERLDAVGNKISDLSQWYSPDPAPLHMHCPQPTGISVLTLKRRSS